MKSKSKSFIETHINNTRYNTKNTNYDKVQTYIYIYDIRVFQALIKAN